MTRNSGDSLEDESIGMTIKLYLALGDSNGPLDVITLESTVLCSISSIKYMANEYLEIWLETVDSANSDANSLIS